MKVYKHQIINDLESFYEKRLTAYVEFPIIKNHLSELANHLYKGVQAKVPAVYSQINNYNSNYLGKDVKELQNLQLTLADCQHTIANEYGFKNWKAVQDLKNLKYNFLFEKSVNTLLEGNLDGLQLVLEKHPQLLKTTSQYGHRATLLHYVGSNGVEMWRQKVPMNLPEITKYLLKLGADKNAKMEVYGGEFDVLSLLVTSAHPFAAGVGEEMKKIF